MYYNKMLQELLGIDSQRARYVEAYLRLEYGTLNHLDASRIKLEYYDLGISEAIDQDPAGAETLAQSYALRGEA